MSTNTKDTSGPVRFLHPLQRRTRTESVTRELLEMGRLTREAALKRAAATDGPAWETLVAMARAYRRAGDDDAARRVLDALVRRVSPTVTKKAALWAGLTPEERTDAKQEAIAAILRGALDLGPGQELWECNFTHCVNFRLITLWKTATRRRGREVSLTGKGADGEEQDGLEQIADPADGFAGIADNAFCVRLARDHPHLGAMLHLRLEGFSDREIAAHLGVTDRTLRNWTKTVQRLWDRDQP